MGSPPRRRCAPDCLNGCVFRKPVYQHLVHGSVLRVPKTRGEYNAVMQVPAEEDRCYAFFGRAVCPVVSIFGEVSGLVRLEARLVG
jgi:hypothetical protein